MLAVVVLDLVC